MWGEGGGGVHLEGSDLELEEEQQPHFAAPGGSLEASPPSSPVASKRKKMIYQ